MPNFAYCSSVSDSRGNTYTAVVGLSCEAHPLHDRFNTGVRTTAFWCQSSLGLVSSITAHFNTSVQRRALAAFRFRNHSGAPFQPRTYGNYDETAFATDRVVAVTPLPTWSFARANGRVFICGLGSLDPSHLQGPNPSDTYRFQSVAGFGLSEQLSISMNFGSGTSGLLGSGTSAGIQPGMNTYGFTAPNPPATNVWRAVHAFGMNPAATFSVPGLILAGDVFHFNNGFNANYVTRHSGNNSGLLNDMSSSLIMSSNFDATSPAFCDTVQTGDGILLIVGCPQVNARGSVALGAVI